MLNKLRKKQIWRYLKKMNSNNINENDAMDLNKILTLIKRFIIVKFREIVPQWFVNIVKTLEALIPDEYRTVITLRSGPLFIGYSIYQSCISLLRSSLNPKPFEAIVNEIVTQFEEYREPSPQKLALESSESASTGSFSTLSPLSDLMYESEVKTFQMEEAKIDSIIIQVLGSGAPGSPASLYLFTDQIRYLFNCGEGTQRLAHEHSTELSRLEHVFTTQSGWNRIGGLPGLVSTLQDIGLAKLTLHGPDGLEDTFSAMGLFLKLNKLKVKALMCEDGLIYDDQVLSVRGISFKKNATEADGNDNREASSSSSTLTVDSKLKMSKKHCASTVISFICRIKPRAGELDSKKSVRPHGPPLGQLKNDETTVDAEGVCSPDAPGLTFLLVDIPSVQFLDSFKNKEELLTTYQTTSACEDEVPSLVIHFSPQHVMEEPVYKNFMKKFAKSTKHLVLNETNRFSGFISSHGIQIQLNQVSESIFPILGEYQIESECRIASYKKFKFDQSNCDTKAAGDLYPQCEPAFTSTYYHLRPHSGLNRSNEQMICRDEYLNESSLIPGFIDSLNELKQQLRRSYANEKTVRADEYPKILFLGTGSRIPNKIRNFSAILVHTTMNSSILLDCGEGTLGQLIRFYGTEKAETIIRNLKAIYVSHLNGDHHLGIIGILEERRRVLTNTSPLMLLAPMEVSSFLEFYDTNIDPLHKEYFFVPNINLVNQPLSDEHTAELGLNYISTCIVRHCQHAFGVAFEINGEEPYKITYSGETIPCPELVRLGQNSTVLIHGATVEEELFEQPLHKMKTTVSQAIEQMNAKYTLLTHFNQRFPKTSILDDMKMNFGIAFDNMELTSVDLKYVHLMLPTLKLLFSEQRELMKNKAMKRMFEE